MCSNVDSEVMYHIFKIGNGLRIEPQCVIGQAINLLVYGVRQLSISPNAKSTQPPANRCLPPTSQD